MQTVLMQLGVGIVAFASTDLDDLVVLLALFLDRKFHPGEVVLGQFVGIGALVAASLAASLTSTWLSREVIGLLGLVPLLMGLFRLRGVFRQGADEDDEEDSPPARASGLARMLAVAAITTGNGGDNIGTYTPLFALYAGGGTVLLIGCFAAMTGIWCALAFWMSRHRMVGNGVRTISQRLIPLVMIGLGVTILVEARSASLLGGLLR